MKQESSRAFLPGRWLIVIGFCSNLLALLWAALPDDRSNGINGYALFEVVVASLGFLGNLVAFVGTVVWAWRTSVRKAALCGAALVAAAFLYLEVLSYTKVVDVGFDDPGAFLPAYPLWLGALVLVLVAVRFVVTTTMKLKSRRQP
jgi:hypothetical protein